MPERVTFETAAAHAEPDVPVILARASVQDVRTMMEGRRYTSASHIVVCDGDRFAGIVTIEDLFAAAPDTSIETLMDRDAPVVSPGVDQEVAAWRAVSHGESALAVVDSSRRFVGMIPPDRLVAVLLAEHEEDLSRLAGVLKNSSVARTASEESVHRRFWHRLPWLLLGLIGALSAADVIGHFEEVLRVHLMLAFFLPSIVYLADAVGTQTETVIVRGLSLGVAMRRMVSREIIAGVVIGAALGALAAPLVWWRWGDPLLAVSVGVSVFAATATSTVAAMMLPWAFDRLGFDPAFGSGPLATVIQDLLSIWIYLLVTTVMMRS